jgi:hypothetical protein
MPGVGILGLIFALVQSIGLDTFLVASGRLLFLREPKSTAFIISGDNATFSSSCLVSAESTCAMKLTGL